MICMRRANLRAADQEIKLKIKTFWVMYHFCVLSLFMWIRWGGCRHFSVFKQPAECDRNNYRALAEPWWQRGTFWPPRSQNGCPGTTALFFVLLTFIYVDVEISGYGKVLFVLGFFSPGLRWKRAAQPGLGSLAVPVALVGYGTNSGGYGCSDRCEEWGHKGSDRVSCLLMDSCDPGSCWKGV